MATPANDAPSSSQSVPTTRVEELFGRLLNEDPQFAATLPLPAITSAKQQQGLRLPQIVQIVMEGYADRPAMGERARELVLDPASGRTTTRILDRFQTCTFGELWDRVQSIAADWRYDERHPVRPGSFVAMLGLASADYALMTLANIYLGAVNVPLQANAPARQHADIIAETDPKVLAASIGYLDVAVDAVLMGTWAKRLVVFDFDPRDDAQREKVDAAGARLRAANRPIVIETLNDAVAHGAILPPVALHVSDEEDPLAWLFYTSGTTGTPKGAMITEQTIRNTWLFAAPMPTITLSFMPMSHLAGHGFLFQALANGGTSFCSPTSDLSTLFDDLRLARPTMASLVPRVCEMLYQHYLGDVDRRTAGGADEMSAQTAAKLDMRDNLLGGRLLFVGGGTAVLSPEVNEFMTSMLGMHIPDYYSSTELAGAMVLVDGRIQRPPVLDYKLADVPELGYLGTDKPHPRGELLVKIPRFMTGYYKQPELTAEKFTEDGFYRTGDVMAIVGPDELTYVDRVNNVQKLSQGEFVAIARLEALYTQHRAIRQIYVYGSSDRAFLLAVVVPSDDLLRDCRTGGEAAARAKASIRRGLHEVAEEHGLAGYEIPRDFLIETQPFTPENGLLTGIGKFSRPNLKKRYGDRLQLLYGQLAQDQAHELRALRAASTDRPVIDTVLRALGATLGVTDANVTSGSRFAELGGDSLSALTLSMLLKDLFDIEVPVGVIVNPAGDLRSIADYVEAQRAGGKRTSFASVHNVDSNIVRASDLELSSFLPGDVIERAPDLAMPASAIRNVLLTGATGFLGRFQAVAWLERLGKCGGKLILLSRGANPYQALRRIEQGLASDPELLRHFRTLSGDHLEVLPGDLDRPKLGLDDATWNRLVETVDLIAHTAAHVNHVLPYDQLFAANVGGTAELICLALSGKMKHFDYVSTLGIVALASRPFDEDCDIRQAIPSCQRDDSYANGYNISKWAGEVLLREAHDLCGLPVSVFRPGMILAHSRYAGQLNVPDMLTRLLLSMAVTGVAPATFYAQDLSGGRPASRYEGMVVDFVADSMTSIGLNNKSGFHTYNLASPHDDGVSLDSFVDWMIEAGCGIERIQSYDHWLTRFETAIRTRSQQQRQQSILSIMEPYRRPHPTMAKSFPPRERFRTATEAAGSPVPKLTPQLIHKYVNDLKHIGLI